MSRCEVAYEESYFYLNKNLWAPLTFAYTTLWQKVAILTFHNVSFNFATAISKFDSFYYHIVHKKIAKVTDDLVMRRPHGLRSRPSHSSLHRSILRRSMRTPCRLSRPTSRRCAISSFDGQGQHPEGMSLYPTSPSHWSTQHTSSAQIFCRGASHPP